MTGGLWGQQCLSEDGASTAVPLRVVSHVHLVVGAIDVVDRSLSLVPVVNFCDGDQLDGLALRKQVAKPKVAFRSFIRLQSSVSSP